MLENRETSRFRVGLWQNGLFEDFDFWAAGLFCGFYCQIFSPHLSGKSKRGLSKGGLSPKGANRAKKGPFGAISGNFCSSPVAVGCRGIGPDRPRPALKWRQFAPKRPDFPGRMSPRFSLKIWGLSPRLRAPLWIFSPHLFLKKCPEKSSRKIPGKFLQSVYITKIPDTCLQRGRANTLQDPKRNHWICAKFAAKLKNGLFLCNTPRALGQVRKNSPNIKFLGGIFLGHPGPRRRDISDKSFMQVAFFCCFRRSGQDVPGFGSGRPGFGKTLCKKTLGWFFVPYLGVKITVARFANGIWSERAKNAKGKLLKTLRKKKCSQKLFQKISRKIEDITLALDFRVFLDIFSKSSRKIAFF